MVRGSPPASRSHWCPLPSGTGSVLHTQCPFICPLCSQSASHVEETHTYTHTHTHGAALPWGKPRKVRVLRKGFLEAEAAKLTLKEEDSGRMPQGTGVTCTKAQWWERASGFRGNKSSL